LLFQKKPTRKDKFELTTAEHWGKSQSWGHSSRRKTSSESSVTA